MGVRVYFATTSPALAVFGLVAKQTLFDIDWLTAKNSCKTVIWRYNKCFNFNVCYVLS